ncbi:metal-dependent hydrolase [Fictibacillus phosphorivorans]|uniref:metal-dependent hydrolase n=1 Tax=Fictibacillus phosphorivorans TaxID=1221500 RepID=UPI0020409C53|nr:metal-dependent hydrolase [Fictibacillus phosphorivorans]MCM3717932.1 metal-dependent hydrolase [Fictibacillus phosphorivorans]MCM3775381.1 metal-dependent hydrolase [Fictibacillus phosphorivorans]
MKVTYHGHSVLEIQAGEHSVWIDPFINGNGQCKISVEDVKADVILLTHGHNDHVGDTVEIAKKNNSLVVAPFELANYIASKGVETHPMHIGGSREFPWGKVKFTQAFHGSSYEEEDGTIVYTGMPAGILFSYENKKLYHAGDTALFSDMKMIGELEKPDAAFLPIGDNFTMGPEDALIAAEWIGASVTVPIHYNTFPPIEQDPKSSFGAKLGSKGKVMQSGESITI